MSKSAHRAYEDWNIADAAARQVESSLAHAWQAYFDGKGKPPSEDLIREVSRLRAIANAKLSATMVAISSLSEYASEPAR